MVERSDSTYDVFLSYAHTDLPQVTALDRALRGTLRSVLGVPRVKVLRDESDLSGGPDLSERLRTALTSSSWLVLYLTKASCASEWVARELHTWCVDQGRADRLIIVRGDASINLDWDDANGRFADPTGLPTALSNSIQVVPLWLEAPANGDDSGMAALAARIVGSILGRSPSEIAGAERSLRRRRRRFAGAAIASLALLTVISVIAGMVAVRSARTAREEQQVAEEQRLLAIAELFGNQAMLEQSARPDKAIALAVASFRLDPDGPGRAALLQLLQQLSGRVRASRLPSRPTAIDVLGDEYAVADIDGNLRVGTLDQAASELQPAITFPYAASHVRLLTDRRVVASLDDNTVVLVDLSTEPATSMALSVAATTSMAVDPAGLHVATGGTNEDGLATVTVLSIQGTMLSYEASSDDLGDAEVTADSLTFDSSGRTLVLGNFRGVHVLDASTLVPTRPFDALTVWMEVGDVAALPDGSIAAGGNPSETADRSGLVQTYNADWQHTGSYGFEQNVDQLAACGPELYFGTRAGEYGRIIDGHIDVLGQLADAVGDIACGDGGGLAVVGVDGFVLTTNAVWQADGLAIGTFDSDFMSENLTTLSDAALGTDHLSVVTSSGSHEIVPAAGLDLAALLDGEPTASSTCLALGGSSMFEADGDRLLAAPGACGGTVAAVTVSLNNDVEIDLGPASYKIAESARVGTYTAAIDDRMTTAFVGGGLAGSLYSLRPNGTAVPMVRLAIVDFFESSTFLAADDLLLTAQTSPQGDYVSFSLFAIGGTPLDRLACTIGHGTLDGTIAVEVLTAAELTASTCHSG